LPPRPASETLRTIVLENAGIQIAVPTDEVLGLELVDDIRPMDASPYGELALGLLERTDGTVATLLDIPRLIDAVRVASPTMREKESSCPAARPPVPLRAACPPAWPGAAPPEPSRRRRPPAVPESRPKRSGSA